MSNNRVNLTDKKFGEWEVLKYEHTKKKQPFWLCKCSCGTQKIVGSNSLRNGSSSCGHKKGWKKGKSRSGKTTLDLVFTNILARYRCDASGRNLSFDLNYINFKRLLLNPCFYCKIKKSSFQKLGKEIIYYNGIDRIDNSKGYSINNVVTCCKKCNLMKRHISVEMVEKVYKLMVDKCIISK